MRNPAFSQHLQQWANIHGLRPSRREPCGHGVLGRGLRSGDHERFCVAQRRVLLDHATLWTLHDARVLVAFPYGPTADRPEHVAFWQTVAAYADRLGIAAYTPPARERLHRLFDTESCALLYGPRGIDLRALSTEGPHVWERRGDGMLHPARGAGSSEGRGCS